jgi:hypothetical protein
VSRQPFSKIERNISMQQATSSVRPIDRKIRTSVLWPSAYSAGTSLQAHALNHHYYTVTSTWTRDCIVYDITGEEILYQKSQDINVARITLDLDRRIYHENFNVAKRDRLLKEHGDAIEQDRWLKREQWFVLRARRPGVSARALAKQYGLEELRDYIDRSRREIDGTRGWEFWRKPASGSKRTTQNRQVLP